MTTVGKQMEPEGERSYPSKDFGLQQGQASEECQTFFAFAIRKFESQTVKTPEMQS